MVNWDASKPVPVRMVSREPEMKYKVRPGGRGKLLDIYMPTWWEGQVIRHAHMVGGASY